MNAGCSEQCLHWFLNQWLIVTWVKEWLDYACSDSPHRIHPEQAILTYWSLLLQSGVPFHIQCQQYSRRSAPALDGQYIVQTKVISGSAPNDAPHV